MQSLSSLFSQLDATALRTAWLALGLTLKVAGCAILLNGVLGIACAWWMARRRGTFWTLLDAMLTLPMVLPPTVIGYYLLVLFGRDGVLGQSLREHFGFSLIFTWQGAVLAASLISFPLVLKSSRAAFAEVEPQFEQAARVLGLSELAVFFRVSLPLAWRGIFAGILLAFARAMGEFGATLMIAGSIIGKTQTLALAVFEAMQAGQEQMALFLVLLISLVSVVLLVAAGIIAEPKQREAQV